VGNIINGVVSLPGQINEAIKSPANAIKAGKNFLGGIATEANQFLGDPIHNAQLVGIQTPEQLMNQTKAQASHAYEHPVNTALDLGAAVGLPGGAPAKVAEEPAVTDVLRTPPPVSKVASDVYMKAYTVPTGLDVNPEATGKWMINDNPNLAKIQDFHNQVNGLKEQVTNDATLQGKQVNTDTATAIASKGIKDIPQLKDNPRQVKGYNSELSAMMPAVQTAPPTYAGDLRIGGATPLDTVKSIKNIESQGYAYRDAARDAYGNVTNVALDKVAKVYLDTATELQTQLDTVIGRDNVQKFTQDPLTLSQMSEFSPAAAARLKDNVETYSDLRSFQKPYVDMSKILNWTQKAGHSAFANLSGGATRAGATGIGTAIGALAGGPIGAAAGGMAGFLGEPFIGAALNKVLPPLTGTVARNLERVGTTANIAKNVGKYGGAAMGAQSPVLNPVPEGVNNNPNNQQNPHSNSITQGVNPDGYFSVTNIPASSGEIKLDAQGKLTLPSPSQIKDASGKVIGMDTNSYNQQVDKIQKDISANESNAYSLDPTIANPAQASIASDKAQLESLKTLHDSSAPLNTGYTFANTVSGKVSTALDMLNTTAPNVVNLNANINDLRKALDPAYAGLSQQLAIIQKEVGNNLNAATKQVLQNELMTINQQIGYDYLTAVKTYVGGNTTPVNPMAPGPNGVPAFPTAGVQPAGSTGSQDFSAITGGTPPVMQFPSQ
jgi:hypothetical protein